MNNTDTPALKLENLDLQNLKPSALAKAFPRPTAEERQRMKDSITKTGLLEAIVLDPLDGSILDGLSRYEVCTELAAKAHFRFFGSLPSDGESRTDFVTGKNLAHRFLTPSQKAVIAEELIAFYETEAAMTHTQAINAAAAATGASPRTVERTEQLRRTDSTGFNKVRAGETTVTTALKESGKKPELTADQKEQEQQRLDDLEATQLKPFREANEKALTKRHGEEFGVAFANGVLLKTKAHLEQFLDMNAEDQKFIMPLVLKKWEPKQALKFLQRILDGNSRLVDLVTQTQAVGKTVKVLVDGYVITARKVSEGEVVK